MALPILTLGRLLPNCIVIATSESEKGTTSQPIRLVVVVETMFTVMSLENLIIPGKRTPVESWIDVGWVSSDPALIVIIPSTCFAFTWLHCCWLRRAGSIVLGVTVFESDGVEGAVNIELDLDMGDDRRELAVDGSVSASYVPCCSKLGVWMMTRWDVCCPGIVYKRTNRDPITKQSRQNSTHR